MKRHIFLLCALLITAILKGQPTVPDRPNPPRLVNDYAGLMSASDINRLENELVSYNDSSSNQITIVTIKSLGDYPIEDWALEIGRKWGIGRKGKNNGVVILVSVEPRRINISPGYGLEGALPDITCKRIISNAIKPSFASGQYAEGFSRAIKSIRGAIKGEFVNEDRGKKSGSSDVTFWIFIVILFIIMIAFIVIANSRRRSAYYGPNQKRHYDNGGGGGWIFWGGSGGGGGNWGGGDSDSGGGFGGFGGGDFGGGGASDDW